MATQTAAKRSSPRPEKIPDSLVKETIDGMSIYFRGYRDVLNKTKTIEQIMADSTLQALLKTWLAVQFSIHLDSKLYWIMSGEVGNHLSKRQNMSLDVVVFEKTKLPAAAINQNYATVPAKLVVEIDTDVEFGIENQDLHAQEYVHLKTQRQLDFGVERVLWIFTQTRKVLIAAPNEAWQTVNWDQNLPTIDGLEINIAEYLAENGIGDWKKK